MAAELDRIARAYGIRLAVQFGSSVTGRVHPGSDVDVGVLLERPDMTLNHHLITDAGHAPPRDYYESFAQLAKLQILPAESATQIAACAGLRTRLVHEYDEIDPRRVYEGLQAAVRDTPEYLRHVHARLEKAP